MAVAWTRRRSIASSSPSTPPRRWARAPDLDCRWRTASSPAIAARSRSATRPVREPSSASFFRSRAPTETRSCWHARRRRTAEDRIQSETLNPVLIIGWLHFRNPLRSVKGYVSMPKILVIDDDVMVRNTISKVLRHCGFEVIVAEDGVRGLASFRRDRPDLVITDIIMPEKEGIETIIEMRREHPDTKIIAVSGGGRIGNADFLSMATSLGAAAVIAKPFLPEELINQVKSCLAA